MKREVDMAEISDGKLYRANDMVKADTGGCVGCSHCCRTMCDTIILDPWDMHEIYDGTGLTFNDMLDQSIELNVQDGLILPNLKQNPRTGACSYLDSASRCSIHASRPGFCRLFPLGRYYEGGDFRYFIQVHECTKADRAKVKVKKWLGIPQLNRYEDYIRAWHAFILNAENLLDSSSDAALRQKVTVWILQQFFVKPWDGEDFYEEFEGRLAEAKQFLGFAQ